MANASGFSTASSFCLLNFMQERLAIAKMKGLGNDNIDETFCGHSSSHVPSLRSKKPRHWVREDSSSTPLDEVLLVTTSPLSPHEWIMSTAATCHVTPNRNYFSTFVANKGNDILLGNRSVCKCMGMGSVRIRMFDGCIRTITDVIYAPDFKTSVISVGKLVNGGCVVFYEGGEMKLLKGDMVVLKGTSTSMKQIIQVGEVETVEGNA